MAQHDYDIANQSGYGFRQDLNNALAAIVSNNSGPSAPTVFYAHQIWIDTSTTPATIKRRDASNANWIIIGYVDGSINLPTVNATAPTNGLYLPAANSVALATNSTNRLHIDSTGKCGIGTTSPATNLEVYGAQGTTLEALRLRNQNAGVAGVRQTFWQDYLVAAFTASRNGLDGRLALQTTDTSGNLQDRLFIDGSGRVLVGTSSTSTSQGASTIIQGNPAGGSTSYGQLVVSVGTSSPANGDPLGEVRFSDSSHDRFAAVMAKRDGGTWSGSSKPTRLEFSTTPDTQANPVERCRITNKGYFKATNDGSFVAPTGENHEFSQTKTDEWALQIYHKASNTANYGLYINYPNRAPNDGGNSFLYCNDSTALRATIRSNGGLHNYSANNSNLSDINAKKDISPAADTWDCIKEWEIVNYRYKDQPDDADLNLGVIAQQVAESCPEVITIFQEAKEAKPAVLDEEGNEVEPAQEAQPERLGVKEQQMYWMAIKALQEAQVRIEALEAEVAALKAQ